MSFLNILKSTGVNGKLNTVRYKEFQHSSWTSVTKARWLDDMLISLFIVFFSFTFFVYSV